MTAQIHLHKKDQSASLSHESETEILKGRVFTVNNKVNTTVKNQKSKVNTDQSAPLSHEFESEMLKGTVFTVNNKVNSTVQKWKLDLEQ